MKKTLENEAYFECRVVVSKMEMTTEKNSVVENKKSPAGYYTDRAKNKKGYKNLIGDIVIVSHTFE